MRAPFGRGRSGRKADVEHIGQHHRCLECAVYLSNLAEVQGLCTCTDPDVQQLPLWGAAECGRCGRPLP
jgi:hypothetical protein